MTSFQTLYSASWLRSRLCWRKCMICCIISHPPKSLPTSKRHPLWQDWNLQTRNKLQQVYPTVPPQSTVFQQREQMLYNRQRISHTWLTHSYHIDHTDPPECTTGNCHQLLYVCNNRNTFSIIFSPKISVIFLPTMAKIRLPWQRPIDTCN